MLFRIIFSRQMWMLQYRQKHDFRRFNLTLLCVTIKPHILTHITKGTIGYQRLASDDSCQNYRSFEIFITFSLRFQQWIYFLKYVGLPNNYFRSSILFQKLTVPQLVRIFSEYYKTRRFIALFKQSETRL